jgi:hypothetical protein
MTLIEIKKFFETLVQAGVRFYIENKKLLYKAEPDILTENNLYLIAQHRREIARLILVNRQKTVQETYRLCREFERTQPHFKRLPPESLAEAKRGYRRMELEMESLECQLERLKSSV